MTTADQLRDIALREFAASGYLGVSIARIAELAGVSKASVLYHYASKEALLEAAIAPAVGALEAFVDRLEAGELNPVDRLPFLTSFVDLLLAHPTAVHLMVNQRVALADVPVMARADAIVERLAAALMRIVERRDGQQIRVGIALAGSAYLVATAPGIQGAADLVVARDLLIDVLADLLAPLSSQTASPPTPSSPPSDPFLSAPHPAVDVAGIPTTL